MTKLLCWILLALTVSGCADMFMTSHQLFVRAMDDDVRLNMTIDELRKYDGDEYGIAGDKYFVKVEPLDNGDFKYHYARATLWPQRYCYYHFLVDGRNKKIKGWEFDYSKGDAKKNCGRRG